MKSFLSSYFKSPFFVAAICVGIGGFIFFTFQNRANLEEQENAVRKYLQSWDSEISESLYRAEKISTTKKLVEGLAGLPVSYFSLVSGRGDKVLVSKNQDSKCTSPLIHSFYHEAGFRTGKVEFCLSKTEIVAKTMNSIPMIVLCLSFIILIIIAAKLPLGAFRVRVHDIIGHFKKVSESSEFVEPPKTKDKTLNEVIATITRQMYQKMESNKLVAQLDSENRHADIIRQAVHDLKRPIHSLKKKERYEGITEKDIPTVMGTLDTILSICDDIALGKDQYSMNDVAWVDPVTVINKVIASRKSLYPRVEFGINHLQETVEVFSTSTELGRVLANIIDNAGEALIDSGSPVVNVSSELTSDRLKISISDNGPGIDSETIGKIFNQGFTQGKASGTGLGLYYVKTKVSEWGGNVTVSSSPTGTRFTVTLVARINEEREDEKVIPINGNIAPARA